ncbi:MAG: hypothetical protein LH473_10545, partial [Chitinophagales bacterium]|nr:hypothetical protein [Chitinophagales bacterium]
MNKKIYITVAIAFTLQIAQAQWKEKSSGLTAGKIIFEMSASGRNNCYGNVYDPNIGFFSNQLAVTNDAGATWHEVTIDSLVNNYIVDVAASTGKVVHALGWNYLTGGGNVFKSKDGGATWKREATKAFTDPASFPDNIAFFNADDGLMFGDPVDGVFEIYTTHDRGSHWHKVPSANIPAPLENEYSSNNYMEIVGNSAWSITYVSNDGYTPTSTRLLQSDDMGETWYVRNSSLPIAETFLATAKFRDQSTGILQNNGKIYRTTDGGSTFDQVNYSGTCFTYDIDFIKDVPGCWISAGGVFGTLAGSSVSYDDGDTWTLLDTNVHHSQIEMVNKHRGFTGGEATGSNDGAFVYAGAGFKIENQVVLCDQIEFNIFPNPPSESFHFYLPQQMDNSATSC